jgi:hypothetical protein
VRSLLAFLLGCAALPAQQAWYTTTFPVGSLTGWRVNGGPPPAGHLTSATSISMLREGGPTGDQEVRGTLRIRATGGSLVLYLRASPDALLRTGTSQGTFYAFEAQVISVGSGSCLMNLSIWKVLNGVNHQIKSAPNKPCVDGMEWRFFIRGGEIGARYDPWRGNVEPPPDNVITSGLAGVGVHSSHPDNGITRAVFYNVETRVPATPANISGAVFGNRVEMQWHGFEDPAPSSGLYLYTIQRWRSGVLESQVHPYTPSYADTTVQPSTAYEYRIYVTDVHRNLSPPAIVAITTPAAGTREPRRIGLRPEGTYWGGAGEQIDMQSGNVNLTLPLISATARGGMKVNFALNYNSQLWRRDGSTVWAFGRDVGYGYGWRMMAGSVTPVYRAWGDVAHYLYTDSTGAEYRLTVNAGGIWTGTEGVMVAYDSNLRLLRFPDGTWWAMWAESAAGEDDAGTLYPTVMQDNNGNRIAIDYLAGTGSAAGNTSARISLIWDAKSALSPDGSSAIAPTWTFGWINNHLETIRDGGFATHRRLTYSGPETVKSPFATDAASYGSAQRLTEVTTGGGKRYRFEYGNRGAGTSVQARPAVGASEDGA